MGEIKPWQIVLIVASLIAVAASAWFTLRGDPEAPTMVDEIAMVDVNTGDLFRFDVTGRKAVSLPGTNPITKRANLIPVFKDDSGSWRMELRDLGGLKSVQDEIKIKIDQKTGIVSDVSSEIKDGR